MTSLNIQDQIIELTDDQLKAAQGGVSAGTFVDVAIGFTPLGPLNILGKLFGSSIGDSTDVVIRELSR
ncbi:hypothetical protein [Synechococcus sp. UW179A]|uniref:hypothetical protein n=1 Tax=Synechococcus sp. UW179A TaxID=2575510 RepID=UPI000E0FB604|nr:hypothetical protein [Synechococcus sp. UW179A]